MKFALIEGVKREPSRTGERGTCPGCEGGVLAKVGPDRVPHWAHQSNSNCDPWFEPETPWHRAWKALVVPDAQEVTIKRDGSHHRADICVGEHGPVIELQQSTIALQEMLDREAFYGRMIWLFDGGRFAAGLSDYWFAANRRHGSVPMLAPRSGGGAQTSSSRTRKSRSIWTSA
jgi:competence protein CoiA